MSTKIEWTEATWNPIVGCSLASPGCTNCYAMKMAGRIEATGHAAYQGLTAKAKTGFVWTGKLGFNEKALLEPLRRRKPTMYFVNSMGDLFHEDCPDEWIDRVFAVMALCPQHTFQVLTKRAGRMREYVQANPWQTILDEQYELQASGYSDEIPVGEAWPLPNVWLGVSVEDQQRADERIPDLINTPAAVRWLSCEPLLAPVDLHKFLFCGPEGSWEWWGAKRMFLQWIVCGGESGPGARPIHPDWARSLRDQCAAADVPFFFKQWGEWPPRYDGVGREHPTRVGKKRAGRLLDGVLHDGMPA